MLVSEMFQRKATKVGFYYWTHWFWITSFVWSPISTAPLSSLETISTSLKSSSSLKTSALIQNDNSNNFEKPILEHGKLDQFKQNPMTIPLESETGNVFDGGGIGNDHDGSYISEPDRVSENLPSKPFQNSSSYNLASIQLNQQNNSSGLNEMALNNLDNSTNTSIKNTSELTNASDNINSTVANATQLTSIQKLEKQNQSGKKSATEQIPKESDFLNVTLEFSDHEQNDSSEADSNFLPDNMNVTEVAELSERKSKVLTGYDIKLINNVNSRSTLQVTQENNDKLSSEALFVTDEDNGGLVMNAGVITGICFAVIIVLGLLSTMSVYVYRRRFLNSPQSLEADSSGYIDDSTIRDNSDEMYSLDNDSFLNSLEAMTIQNYWTDTVKHTKL